MGAMTRLYMNGFIRSWIHYLNVRNEPHAQYDHQLIARRIQAILAEQMPIIAEAAGWT
jgi:thymidylate synthase (FAD)